MSSIKNGARYVRCPRCRQVIVEYISVPIYQCGVCKTTLQAKCYSYKDNNNSVKQQNSTSLSDNPRLESNSSIQVRNIDSFESGYLSNHELVTDKGNDSAGIYVPSHPEQIASNDNRSSIGFMGDQTEHKEDSCKNAEARKHSDSELYRMEGLKDSAETFSTDISSSNKKTDARSDFSISPKSAHGYGPRNSSSVGESDIWVVDSSATISTQNRLSESTDTLLQSEGFYTVQSRLEQEIDAIQESLLRNDMPREETHKLQVDIPSAIPELLESVRKDIMKKLDCFRNEINTIFSELKHGTDGFHLRQSQESYDNCRSGLMQDYSVAFGPRRYSPEQCRLTQAHCHLHCHAPCICCCCNRPCHPCRTLTPQLPTASRVSVPYPHDHKLLYGHVNCELRHKL